jgi:hypothetical protein
MEKKSGEADEEVVVEEKRGRDEAKVVMKSASANAGIPLECK